MIMKEEIDLQLCYLKRNSNKKVQKDWLDNNLPKIVENIVSNEIKKIIPKK